jgi:hypothetical protein
MTDSPADDTPAAPAPTPAPSSDSSTVWMILALIAVAFALRDYVWPSGSDEEYQKAPVAETQPEQMTAEQKLQNALEQYPMDEDDSLDSFGFDPEIAQLPPSQRAAALARRLGGDGGSAQLPPPQRLAGERGFSQEAPPWEQRRPNDEVFFGRPPQKNPPSQGLGGQNSLYGSDNRFGNGR